MRKYPDMSEAHENTFNSFLDKDGKYSIDKALDYVEYIIGIGYHNKARGVLKAKDLYLTPQNISFLLYLYNRYMLYKAIERVNQVQTFIYCTEGQNPMCDYNFSKIDDRMKDCHRAEFAPVWLVPEIKKTPLNTFAMLIAAFLVEAIYPSHQFPKGHPKFTLEALETETKLLTDDELATLRNYHVLYRYLFDLQANPVYRVFVIPDRY